MTDVYWACAFVLACIAFYRFGLPWLRRFDARNVARKEREARDRSDANAHIRHALEVAEEQVEEIQEIKVGDVTHFLFEAEVFATRDEAEEMRARRIGVVARRFYAELPAALMSRSEPRSNLSARERAAQRWKRTIH
ncbi:MAG TPA: hypothetical protein VGG66_01625 [Rhizomicrobium sp.]|jgi:hypothetical protein